MDVTTDVRRRWGALKSRLVDSTRPAAQATEPQPGPWPPLDAEQERQWSEEGYVVLPQFFDRARLDGVLAELDDLWSERARDDRGLVIDTFIDTPEERRIRFRDAEDGARAAPYKLNDLFLVSSLVREMVLDPALVGVLDHLL